MTFRSTATVLGLVTLALGPLPSALLPMTGLDMAHAESGKSNGNGNGNGSDKGTGAGSHGNSANAPAANGATRSQAGQNSGDDPSQGDLASELKGLNAVKANPNALDHAAPNSQVGRIAAYRDAAELTLTVHAALQDAEAVLAGLDVPARSTGEIDAAIADLDPAAAGYAETLAALEAERALAATYEEAVATVATAAARMEAATAAEAAALLTASGGRVLSHEAIAHIRSVLDL
jgi:hypothetical protein